MKSPISIPNASKGISSPKRSCPYIEVGITKLAWKNNYTKVAKENLPITGPFEWTPSVTMPIPDPDNFFYIGCSDKPAIYFVKGAVNHTKPTLEVTLSVERMCTSAIPESSVNQQAKLEIDFGQYHASSKLFTLPDVGSSTTSPITIELSEKDMILWTKGEPTFTLYYELNGSSASKVEIKGENNKAIILEMFVLYAEPENFYVTGVWLEVLRFLFEKTGINKDNDIEESARKITSYLHSKHGLTYDTVDGSQSYSQGYLGGYFKLNNYLHHIPDIEVNCYDQAGAVQSLCGGLGIKTQWIFMNPYGFITDTDLVNNLGLGSCNNPFYNAGYPFSCDRKVNMQKDIHNNLIAGTNGYPLCTDSNNPHNNSVRSAFGNHAFILLNSNNCILDACAGPALAADTLSDYAEKAIDKECNIFTIGFDGKALISKPNVITYASGVSTIEWY